MNNIIIKILLIRLPRITLWIFLGLNILSMLLYPGGTYKNHFTLNYSFSHNFLSDLGRTITFSSKINFFSSQIFNISLIIAGIVYFLFYLNVIKIFQYSKQKMLAYIGSIFGMFGGISLIGVGFTPANLYLDIHILFANWLFRFMFLASLLYSIVIYYDSKYKNKYALGYLFFTICILFYIIISELGPSPQINNFALMLQVISQKIILIIFMLAIYIQTLGIEKLNEEK